MYFSILNCVKTKTTHSIAPLTFSRSLLSCVTVSECCIAAVVNSAIWVWLVAIVSCVVSWTRPRCWNARTLRRGGVMYGRRRMTSVISHFVLVFRFSCDWSTTERAESNNYCVLFCCRSMNHWSGSVTCTGQVFQVWLVCVETFDVHCCHMATAIKHPVPDWV